MSKAEKYNRILIIRFSSLGDVILTTPLVEILKQSYPDSQIDFCTRAEYSDILQNNPDISEIISIGGRFDFQRLRELKNQLVAGNYDLVIDAHNNLRTFYLRQSLRFHSKVLKFRKYSLRKFLLVKFKINLMETFPPVIQRYAEILSPVADIPNFIQSLTPKIFIDKSAETGIDELLTRAGLGESKKIITISPASKHHTKSFPPEKYAALIEKLGPDYEIILVGTGNDSIHIDQIIDKSNRMLHNLCDKLSLPELAALIKRSSLFISGDTGPMHIAEAFNIPLIMLAGSSVKEFGFYPQNKNSTVFEINELSCRPCSHIGRSKCPKGHFRCMNDISVDSILHTVNDLI